MELNQRASNETRARQREARTGRRHSPEVRELIRLKALLRSKQRRELGLPDSAPNSLLSPYSEAIHDSALRTGYQRAAAKEDGRELRIVDGATGVRGVQLR